MTENRLPDYIDHIQQAAADACGFVEGMTKDDFSADRRTQRAVIMSLIVIGDAARMPTMQTATTMGWNHDSDFAETRK